MKVLFSWNLACSKVSTKWYLSENISKSESIDGWMTCDFTFFSTVFQSYQDEERVAWLKRGLLRESDSQLLDQLAST